MITHPYSCSRLNHYSQFLKHTTSNEDYYSYFTSKECEAEKRKVFKVTQLNRKNSRVDLMSTVH